MVFKNAQNFDEKNLIFREANFIENAKIWLLWSINVLPESNGGSLVDKMSYALRGTGTLLIPSIEPESETEIERD